MLEEDSFFSVSPGIGGKHLVILNKYLNMPTLPSTAYICLDLCFKCFLNARCLIQHVPRKIFLDSYPFSVSHDVWHNSILLLG